MKVKLHSILAGPDLVAHPGVVDLPEALVRELLRQGYATPIGPTPEAETAALPEERAGSASASLKSRGKRS